MGGREATFRLAEMGPNTATSSQKCRGSFYREVREELKQKDYGQQSSALDIAGTRSTPMPGQEAFITLKVGGGQSYSTDT